MAKKKDERFLKVHEEGNGFGWMRTVWVDKQTGVNYLFVNSGYAGGMTVLLGADGKPVTADNNLYAFLIENKSGAELPSTGGIGTTVFYVLGGLLVVCAGVLLITKRRMNKNA